MKSPDPSVRKAPSLLSALSSVSSEHSTAVRRALVSAAYFFLSLILSGTEVFPGTYPLGLSLLSSVTGFLPSVASLAGSLIGSFRITAVREIYLLAYPAVILLRLVSSLWLSSDGKGGFRTVFRDLWDKLRDTDSARSLLSVMRSFSSEHCTSVLREDIRVRVALSAVVALFSGAWSLVGGGYIYYDLFGAVFSTVTVPVFTYLFYSAVSRNMRGTHRREIGIYFVSAAVVLSLHSVSHVPLASAALDEAGIAVHGFSFDFGILAAFAITSLVAVTYGTHRGVLCGMICGAVLTPLYAPAYALGAVASGVLSSVSPVFAILFGGTLTTAWGIYVGGFNGMALLFPPVVAACAIVAPSVRFGLIKLPPDLFSPTLTDRQRAEAASMSELSLESMRRRLSDLSDGLCSVSSVLDGVSKRLSKPEKADMREIVESSFSLYCATCKKRDKCAEYASAAEDPSTPLVRAMADRLTEYGTVSADVIPPSLASECASVGRILDSVNLTASHKIAALTGENSLSVTADDFLLTGEIVGCAVKNASAMGEYDSDLSARLSKLLLRSDFAASSVAAYGGRRKRIFVDDIDVSSTKMGADDIRTLFGNAAGIALSSPEFRLDGAVLSMELRSEAPLCCVSGYFSLTAGANESSACADGENDSLRSVCGDVIRTFSVDGYYYILLSDGMGTGKEAALTSGMVAALLERLIVGGADLTCALKMLNHIVRATGRECAATVDIAEIDTVTGCAKFVKSGAAPSFVLRDGAVFRLQSKTVPIGIIRALDAEMLKFDILPGDTVVMLSDGAARSYEEVPWLLDMMAHDEDILSGDEKKAAEKIVKEARRRGSHDDITAGVIRINAK